MSLTATVISMTTCTRPLLRQPKLNRVTLNCEGRTYIIDAVFGLLTVDQVVEVEPTSLARDGTPNNLRLAS
jgi:hypothetical protein